MIPADRQDYMHGNNLMYEKCLTGLLFTAHSSVLISAVGIMMCERKYFSLMKKMSFLIKNVIDV